MAETKGLEVVTPGTAPPCLRTGGLICRGCPGWEAMLGAIAEDGTWAGTAIHCGCTGLTVRRSLGSGRAR